jgi:hypothetical protein
LVGFVLSPPPELSREIAVVRPALNLGRTQEASSRQIDHKVSA